MRNWFLGLAAAAGIAVAAATTVPAAAQTLPTPSPSPSPSPMPTITLFQPASPFPMQTPTPMRTIRPFLVGEAGPARAASDGLDGKMAMMSYLTGAPWTCSTKMSAMGGEPAHAGQSTVTFDVVPGNVVHDHISGPQYVSDDYYGFNPKSNAFWTVGADNQGSRSAATSTDGITYTGTSWNGSSQTKVRSTYPKGTAHKVTVHEVFTNGGHQATFDAACTR
jgi:hypothetical protein